jgi:D-arabinose 1-dehydrogenase-like Zn-dependent alcohol dehydrogenase
MDHLGRNPSFPDFGEKGFVGADHEVTLLYKVLHVNRDGNLATAPDSKSMSALVDRLTPRATLMVVGAGLEWLTVTPLQHIAGSKVIHGWTSGHPRDSQDTLQFSALSGVRPMIERYPLEKAAEAYDHMTQRARAISGRADDGTITSKNTNHERHEVPRRNHWHHNPS